MKSSIRPFPTAAIVALSLATLSLATIVFSPSLASAQEQGSAKRKIVSQVVPTYPELASKMRITGTVKVEALVATNGKVKATQVVGGSPVLVKAAVEAIEKWKWDPATQETKELIELNFHP
jgi:TonB family protein